MLLDDVVVHSSSDFKTVNAAAPGRPKQGTAPTGGSVVREATSVGVSSLIKPDVIKICWLTVDAHVWW
jgi:hypothetical protein